MKRGRQAEEMHAARPAARDVDSSAETSEEGPGGFFPEILRRGLTLGFTGLFMTEEALRKALGDSASRDVLEFLLQQSERMRSDFLDRLSKEFGRVLSAMDPVELAKRLLEGRTVEITARVRFVPESSADGEEEE